MLELCEDDLGLFNVKFFVVKKFFFFCLSVDILLSLIIKKVVENKVEVISIFKRLVSIL